MARAERLGGIFFLHSCRLLYYPPLDKNETALHCWQGRFFLLLLKKDGYLGVCQATQRVDSTGERL